MASDALGFRSVNPLFMKYTPTEGKFTGQRGYGYRSFEEFVDAAGQTNAGIASAASFDYTLASVATTYGTTAILEAGRLSLDLDKAITIVYNDAAHPTRPSDFKY